MADPSRGLIPPNEKEIQARLHQHSEELKKALVWASNPVALLEMARDAIIIRDSNNVVQFWNPGASDLYGWSAEEAIGTVTHELLETRFPASKEDVEWSLMNVGHWEGELSHRRKDRSRITVASRQALRRDEDGKPVLILEIDRDVTEERRKSEYLKLLSSVAAAACEARTIEEAVQLCLDGICAHTSWCVGHAYLLKTEDVGDLKFDGVWYFNDPERFAPFREFTEANALALETGLAGRVLKSGKPVWISDVNEDSYFSTGVAARDTGLKSALGLPVLVGTNVVAMLEIFSEKPVERDESLLEVMANVGRQLGRVFERVTAEEAQRRLSISLLRSQDDERRRIARELHDSAGQYLAVLKMCLEQVRNNAPDIPAPAAQKLNEASEIASKCTSEIRTLSYLLHPPLLDEMGLASAARWYVEGFASRSEMKVELEIPPQLGRLDKAIELALFRVLQECLTNIHRHSGSKTATVRIDADSRQASLEVSDRGKGIAKRTLELWSGAGARLGVGISGMRERMKDLGGTLEISSSEQGTTVKAVIPVPAQILS